MSGQHMTADSRTEREAIARRLRAQGLTYREIGERMGVGVSTAAAYVNDPGGRKDRARKDSYRGSCLDCGAPTCGNDGPSQPSPRCHPCAVRARTIWTREAIITAIQAWARETGGIPPAATDWNPAQARNLGHPEKAEKFYEDGPWPHITTVRCMFGNWSAAIRAAGFAPRRVGKYGREGEDMDLCREIRVRYEAGESPEMLADEYGCSSAAIGFRVRKAGGSVRTCAEAQRLRRERERIAA